jgi:hypothetical protein
MEASKEYVSVEQEHQLVLDDHNLCCLCGTKLKFQHKVDYQSLVVKEEAYCPSCQIQMKKRDFTLQ